MGIFQKATEFLADLTSSDLQLYELDNDPKRKEFLDELFVFMQKRGERHSFTNLCFSEPREFFELFNICGLCFSTLKLLVDRKYGAVSHLSVSLSS